MKINEKFMKEVIVESKKAKDSGDLPFGAVIALDNEIIGRGGAKNNTTGDVTDHAEIIALREACKKLKRNRLSDCIIYCSNEPCNMCASAIFQAGISNIVIGASRSDLPNIMRPRNIDIEKLSHDLSFEVTLTRDIMKSEVLELFEGVTKK